VTPAIWLALAEIGASLPESVRVAIVRAEGPSFCAGIDLKVLAEASTTGASQPLDEEQIAGYQAGYLWLADPAIVSIAAVQGHAIGAGFQLALACDVRIVADDAKFCMKEPALGLVPDLTGTKPLVDIVGLPRAIELCLTTRTIEAGEAIALRLAELMVPGSELDAAVGDLVAALLATDAAAARATKALLRQAGGNTLQQQAAAERQAQLRLLKSRLRT
jgi:enoyl-CoA hydratase/carnithine racemase